MTTQQFNTIATENLSQMPTSELVKMAKMLVVNYSDNSDMIYDVTMNLLMDRMPEKKYSQFCEELGNML